jgi:arylsulfatase A-like enzyme
MTTVPRPFPTAANHAPPRAAVAESAGDHSAFWPATLLALTLVVAKAAYLDSPGHRSGQTLASYLTQLSWVAAADILFALAVGLAGETLLLATRRRPRLHAAAFSALITFCAVSVGYAVVSVKIFAYFRTPLNASLISLGGDVRAMRSSLIAFASPPLLASALLAPPAYLILATRAHQRWPRPLGRRARDVVACAAVATVTWFLAARTYAGRPDALDDWKLSQNPHTALIASFVREAAFTRTDDLPIPFAADYAADFKRAAERADAVAPTPGLARGPKNVIVVVCESVGTQFLSLYGSPYRTWPRMEAEARHAVVFDNYYANVTNSANAMFSLTLSNYPPLRGGEHTIKRAAAPGTSAAQILAARGYRTAMISAGYNAWANQDRFLQNRGYDTVWDAKDSGCPELNSWGVEDRCMVDMVLRYLDRAPDREKPFYVFAWSQANHHPYGPEFGQTAEHWDNPDLLKGETKFGEMTWDLGRYLAALYELDKQLGRLFDELRRRDLADDTIVLITGDHGEVFGWPHKAYGHGGGVYQEYVNVPFVVWSPALFQHPARSKEVGGHVDVQATVLDLLGLPPAPTWQGRSMFAPDKPPRTYFFGSADQGYLGLRDGDWKYAYNRLTQGEQLYDLSTDPLEQTNLAATHRDRCREFRQRIAAWAAYQRNLWQ